MINDEGGFTMKRLLNCHTSDFNKMDKEELKQAILASAGRTILGETVVIAQPLLQDLTNAEVIAGFGGDMILLNFYDVYEKKIMGISESEEEPIKRVKELTGLPVGINLEPVDEAADALEDVGTLPAGRRASRGTLMMAAKQGIDYVCLTGNPATGVSNREILHAIEVANECFPGLIIAGKMHGAGLGEPVINKEIVLQMIEKGADIILLPACGTVPGISEAMLHEMVTLIHEKQALCMAAIGTSQESADLETIRAIGLADKRIGFDIHHIGDGGFGNVPDPENLMALSITVRGKRHTYYRMAQSINR